MRLNVLFLLGSCLITFILRLLLRSEIKPKYWKKHKSEKVLWDWFLLGFRIEKSRRVWIDLHFALFVGNFIAFTVGTLGYFIEAVSVLQIFPFIVFLWNLVVFACKLLCAPQKDACRRIEGLAFGGIFILLMLALSVILGYYLVKGLLA